MRFFLSALPLLAVTPALAQQATGSDPVVNLPRTAPPPADDPRRQGPELDVFRGAATPTPTPTPSLPPIVAPTGTPAPAQRTPAPAQRTPATTATPQRQAPARTETPPAARPTPTPAPRPAERPAPRPAAPAQSAPTPVVAAPEPDNPEPDNAANTAQTPPPALPAPEPVPADNGAAVAPAETAPVAEAEGLSWPWIVAAVAAIAVLGGFLLLRRRRDVAEQPDPVQPPLAAATPPAPPRPTPASEPEPVPPAPEPVLTAAPVAPVADSHDRPWIDMALDVSLARYSLMGVTIGYTLILHNRGDQPAQDILVRGILGNAGAQQDELLRHFFAGETGLPLHSIVSLPAGETMRIASELRLATDQIAAVDMNGRSLLIPLAAFDAHYRWADADDAPLGNGRTGRAFIIGQDKDPPADRLAPFRLDEGPRQYRRPAARAAAEVPST